MKSREILSQQEMQRIDELTINDFGIPSFTLMETAALACVKHLPYGKKALIVCGCGNNGGDGLALARLLAVKGKKPDIFFVGETVKMSPETALNYQLCQKLEIKISKEMPDWYGYDYIVDAIFGNGLTGNVKGEAKKIIEAMNNSGKDIISIDLPSGLNANTGGGMPCVQAKITLAIEALKYAHLLTPDTCGKIILCKINIPPAIYAQVKPRAELVTDLDFVERARQSHKGSYGHLGIIAGSAGMCGAGVLAVKAALKSGAGLVTHYYSQALENCFGQRPPEALTCSYPEEQDIYEQLAPKLEKNNALLLGCGLGKTPQIAVLIDKLLDNYEHPIVFDADALNVMAQQPRLLTKLAKKKAILTPHVGEFCRLAGLDKLTDPVMELAEFGEKFRVTVLLKSHVSILYDTQSGAISFINRGNASLAKGGTGDTLAGIIGSFCAQGKSLAEAAKTSSFLLGMTAEKLSAARSDFSLLASEIIAEF